jgi:type 1 glutamine amidotransferase
VSPDSSATFGLVTRILVFSKTTGYRHESIEVGVDTVRELGAEHGFDVDATEDAAAFTPGNLSRYTALLFLSTSGDVFDDDQRAAFESYVRGGGGYIGVHGASTAECGWPFYGEVVGARFDHHPKVQPATVLVEDADHPATAHLDRTWPRVDEWYAARRSRI